MRYLLALTWGILAFCQPTLAQDTSKWKSFSSQEGRFSIRMPGTPKEEPADKTDEGSPNSHTFILDRGDTAYFVTYTDLPADVLKKSSASALLKAARDGGIKNVKGRLVGDHEITLNGNPGREVLAAFALDKNHQGRAKMRLYLVQTRLYLVMLVGTTAQIARPETDAFLKSFQLRSEAAQNGWKEFASHEGRFSILLPAAPQEETKALEGGGEIHQFTVDRGSYAYVLSYNDLDMPPAAEEIPQILAKGRDAVAKSLGGKVQSEKEITLAGFPGKDLTISVAAEKVGGDGIALLRTFLVKKRYYQVLILGAKAGVDKAQADRVFASFHLDPAPSDDK